MLETEIADQLKPFLSVMEASDDKYTILLPTYNEKENLPIIVYLLCKYLNERWWEIVFTNKTFSNEWNVLLIWFL